jgi:hypothetical protein
MENAIRNDVSDERQVRSKLDMSKKYSELRARIKVELVKLRGWRAKIKRICTLVLKVIFNSILPN